ncbi:MAG: DegV family protein [Bacilli bacterium]|nr:DegV family protein [Bacilli bacterium]MBN2877280.1 DegV family protein [Bacilli bacterium]
MSDYIILTDSCVDIPDSLSKELGLVVLPLKVTIRGKEYDNLLDESQISSKVFYDMLRQKESATTAQANPQGFVSVMEPLLKKGLDILSISFSSALSGTYNSSLIAAKELEESYPDRTIITIDSLCASMGQGLLVTYAGKLRNSGKSIDEVAAFVEATKLNISHLFTVSDLGHLRRGGRLSASSLVLGNLLNIKPLLHVSQAGELKVYGKARGRFKSLNLLVNRMVETFDKEKNEMIYISHGDSLEDALYVRDAIQDKLDLPKEMFLINPIGPVIGAHSGVETLAIFYIGSERFAE